MTRKQSVPALPEVFDATRARRKFLAGAAAATAGAATLGFPMIAKAQGPISMRWQSA